MNLHQAVGWGDTPRMKLTIQSASWSQFILQSCLNILGAKGPALDAAIAARREAELKHGYHENHGKDKMDVSST